MITDEYVDSLLTRLVRAGSNTEREIIESWIKPILTAERNRLLDECLGICDMKMSEVLLACGELSRQEIRTVQAVLDMLKCKVEALRHE